MCHGRFGWGSLSPKPDIGREYESAANLVMGAVGIDGLLVDRGAAGLSLSTTTDLLAMSTTTEGKRWWA
ncbi:MAG: hypothetical protein OXF67_03955 [Cyanobacteria bacterium MAG CAR4_bin_6]|nr:hypothetical protein [Cyanobacteria bacterium MAG CAR4_bin_6]MCY4235056.1 hypothetical protein [Cyanobacteria bacterium MAG CAR2_bin_4]